MCSCARIGLPAATRPTSGSVSCARLGSGRLNCLPRASLQRAQCVRLQADAARGAADQFDHALARQRLQVLFGGVGRAEAEFGGDLGAGGRGAGALDRALHQVEDLLLAVGELGAFFDHGAVAGRAWSICPVTVFSSRSQTWQAPIATIVDPGHRRHDRRHRRRAPPTTSATAPAQLGVDAAGGGRAGAGRLPIECEQVAQLDSKDMDLAHLAARWRSAWRTTWRGPRWPASSSRTAPTRWRKRPTSCTACWRRPSRWC